MVKVFAGLLAAAALTIGVSIAAPESVSAGCDSCGCPNAKGPKPANRIGVGNSSKKRVSGGTSSTPVNEGSAVDWQDLMPSTWTSAQSSERTIVLYFTKADSPEPNFGADLADASKKSAVFVKVFEFDLVDAEIEVDETAKSVLPQDKLNADNLWTAYDVSKAGTVIVCDWFGNEFERYSSMPADRTLLGEIDGMAKSVEKKIESLEKRLERVNAAVEKDESARAVKECLKVFEEGFYGYDVVNTTVSTYEDLIDAGRAKLEAAREAGDDAAVRNIARDYKGTELETEAADKASDEG